MNRNLLKVLGLLTILVPLPFTGLAQIPYGAPATSTILNSTFGAKAYPNTWTGVNTFGTLTLSGPITSSGTNTWSGSNTFSSALLAPTMTFTDNSTSVATTAFVKGQNYITSSGAPVQSVFGRSGTVVATSGDYTTSQVTEGTNLYFTNPRALSSTLTGWGTLTGAISSADTVLSGIEKNAGNLAALSTTNVTEGTNLYFTNTRGISSTLTGFTAGAGTISSADTVLTALQKDAGNTALKAPLASPTFTGTVTLPTTSATGDLTASGKLKASSEFILDSEVNSTLTGALQSLTTYTHPTIILTNASLTSLGAIASPVAGKVITIVNRTSGSLTIKNEDTSQTAANRIITGTASDLTAAANTTLIFLYSSDDSRWHIAGGSGGGGLSTQALGEGSASSITNLQVPNNQYTTTGTNTRLIETGNKNWLLNPSFEATTYSTSWTVTNSTGSSEVIAVADGLKASKHALSAQTGDILVQNVTPTQLIAGQNLEANCRVNTTLSTVQVCALINGTEVQCQNVPSTGNYVAIPVNMTSSVNGLSVGVKVKVTASSTGNVYVDDCYVGQARNLGQVSVDTDWAAYIPTYTGFGTVTNALEWRRSGDSIQIKGKFTVGTATAVEARVSFPNSYVSSDTTKIPNIQLAGEWTRSSSTAQYQTILVEPSVGYVTFAFQTSGTSGLTKIVGTGIGTGEVVSLIATVPILGWTSAGNQTVSQATGPASWNGYESAGSGWTLTGASFGDFSAGSTITSGVYSSKNITCTFAPSSLPGISCTLPRAGTYQVCATGTYLNSAGTGGSAAMRLVDGSSVVINPGMSTAGVGALPYSMCGNYPVASISSPTVFKLQAAAGGGGTVSFANTFTGQQNATFTVLAIDQALPAPILTGSVTQESTGSDVFKRFNVSASCTTGTCTMTENSGFNSCAFSSTGVYNCAFTNAYSSKPVCLIGMNNNWGGVSPTCQVDPTNTTSTNLRVNCFTSGSNTAQNSSFSGFCSGPK
jgi:hypothetical protein